MSCLKRIDAECFRTDPAWAKQAFAYRLLHTLTPREITRRLPKPLRLALLAPGIVLPPGVELPPGATVPPGADIPPGWTPDMPWPAGVGVPPAQPPTTGPIGPSHITPDPAGPLPIFTPKVSPPVGGGWFSLTDDTYWNAVWTTGGTPVWTGTVWDCPSSRCRLRSIGTWFVGYRPTHIRVTCQNCTNCHLSITGDLGDTNIADDASYNSGDSLALDWSENVDIDYFYIYSATPPDFEVSNIEFFQTE